MMMIARRGADGTSLMAGRTSGWLALALLLLAGAPAKAQESPFAEGLTAVIDAAEFRRVYAQYAAASDRERRNIKDLRGQLDKLPSQLRLAQRILVHYGLGFGLVFEIEVSAQDLSSIQAIPNKPAPLDDSGPYFGFRRGGTVFVSGQREALDHVAAGKTRRELPADDRKGLANKMAAAVVHFIDASPGANGRLMRALRWEVEADGAILVINMGSPEKAAEGMSRFGGVKGELAKEGLEGSLEQAGSEITLRMKGNGFVCMSVAVSLTVPMVLKFEKRKREAEKRAQEP